MKKWENPSVEELNLTNTEHGWTGIYRDGGYIGDGHVGGHLTWDKNNGGNNNSGSNNSGSTQFS